MQPLRDRLLRYRVTLVPHSSGDRVDWLPPLGTPGVVRLRRPAPPTDGLAELLSDLDRIDAWGLDVADLADIDGPGPDRPLADVIDLATARARRSASPEASAGARSDAED